VKIKFQHWAIYNIWLILGTTFLLAGCSGFVTPYNSSFECPEGFNGNCQSVQDSLSDSVLGVNPQHFDKKYVKKRKAFNKSHKALIEARQKKMQEQAPNLIDGSSGATLSSSSLSPRPNKNTVDYRGALFAKYKDILEKPSMPIMVPSTPMRALILDSKTGDDGLIYTPPHYVYFIIDGPHWLLKKISEYHSLKNLASAQPTQKKDFLKAKSLIESFIGKSKGKSPTK